MVCGSVSDMFWTCHGWDLKSKDLRCQDQAPASSGFLLRVEFESSSSKKFEYRVEYRVAIAVVGSVILDVIIISDIAVILSRLDWILK